MDVGVAVVDTVVVVADGIEVGTALGDSEGLTEGGSVGVADGLEVRKALGDSEGLPEGDWVGSGVKGTVVGSPDGLGVGASVGQAMPPTD